MTTADAAAVLAQYAGDAEMQRIGRIWDRMNKSKLREMVAAGLIEQEEMDAFTSTYKHWAPLRTMSKDESAWTGMGRGHDIRNAEFKRAMGRETMADNPLDFGFASYAMSIVRAEKAVVGRAFLAAIEANPDPGFATIGEVKFKRVIDKKSGMVRRVYDLASENDPEVLIVKRDGKKIRIRINERYVILAQALKNQNTVHGGKITESVAKATRLYSGALTRDNPFFMLFNGWRDFGNAKKVAKGEMGVQVKLRDMFKVYAALNQASDPKATGTLVERARLYRRAGAPITFLDLGGLSQQTKELGNLFTKKGMVKGTAKKWLDASRRWNDIVENGARFMAFNDMVERGHSVDRAAFYAKELGTNFERHGDIGPAMNAYFMFANAGVGSLRRFGQAVKHPDVRRSIYAVIAWAVMRDMANRLIAGIDPEDEENYYDKLLREKPYIADSNLIMFYGRGEGDYIMLPQPFIFRWFSALGTKASAVANGAIKPGQATGELMSGLLEEVSPLGGAEHPAQTLSPWFLDPLTDTWVNKNWAGSPIYPTKFDPSQPDSELYFPGAPKWAIAAARHMNRLTGGTSAEPGFVSVSPESLDHFSHFLTPGVFSELRRLGAATAELDVNVEDVPIVRRVIGRANPYYAQARARDAFKQIQSAPKRNEALKAEGREPSADAIFASPSWLARMKRVKKQYGVLDDKYRAAKGKEKDELLERIDKLLKPFNRDARKALE